ncbi:hypothetical protein ATM97_27970 [Nocardia sp. MH4]|nr:hypothetical protein [Nocardia sp. MH4]
MLARLRFHSEMASDGLDFPRFTVAIASVVAATALGLNAIGDEVVDPFLASMRLGENLSDLLGYLYLVAACSFFAGQSLTILTKRLPGDRASDLRPASLIGCGVVALALIALSRLSSARTVPAIQTEQFTDPAAVLYTATFWSVIIVTATLVLAAAVVGSRDHGLHGQLAAMGVAGGISAVIATFVLSRLIFDHGRTSAWLSCYGQWWTVPGLIGITVAGLLGIPRSAIRPRR